MAHAAVEVPRFFPYGVANLFPVMEQLIVPIEPAIGLREGFHFHRGDFLVTFLLDGFRGHLVFAFSLITVARGDTPFADDDGDIFLGFLDLSHADFKEETINPWPRDRIKEFHREDVDMGIQEYVFEFLLAEELVPFGQAEAIMEYDDFILWQDLP